LQEDGRPCRAVTSDDSFGSRGIVKRKFTIGELKRICAFPDDFILTGSYAQQWERLGNSVPPVMMFHVAREIRDGIFAGERLKCRKAAREKAPKPAAKANGRAGRKTAASGGKHRTARCP
jgi:hypothetical protein